MQFAYTILYVRHVEATLAFYEQAFGFERRFLSEVQDYGELDTGSTVLAFASEELAVSNGVEFIPNDPSSKRAPGMELAFATTDPQGAYERALAQGASDVRAPAMKPWGQTVGYVRDPNGILLEICSPMAPNA